MKISVWCEGYIATGSEKEHAEPRLLGTFKGKSLDDVIQRFIAKDPKYKNDLVKQENGLWTIWACGLFDNKEAASKWVKEYELMEKRWEAQYK